MVAERTVLSLITSHPGDVLCLMLFAPLALLQSKLQRRRGGKLWTAAVVALLISLETFLYINGRIIVILLSLPLIICSRRMCVPAVTGGIGSGKSTLARVLADNGYTVVDCDAINRELLLPGSPAYASIIRKFGAGIVLDNGEIDRAQLREIVFNNEARRLELNKCLHKYIGLRVIWNIFKYRVLLWRSRVVLDVPLLYNTPLVFVSSPVVVVVSPVESRLERLMSRDGTVPRATLQNIIKAQVSDDVLCAWGDIILDNSQSQEEFVEQVESLISSL
ncbi:dephospho-CoA kinase, putative [Babesia bigemina]|uniref:Dephospho-CoA kinase, putative n=1 Tax=Babesia bigemina TaxID=5866 RepID=A0A061D655_BABBI|nr:dephospho-CoA kinase, putative [Babesia bigemina]CDR94404.1 dephospho-CoA kinase, putative [Babesia bigemina]|eukprot:XP_012766590.1 dephospho-CoA kinase, putative [Babesia bigemina]